ncbi:MAG: SDR family oxidoreductase [Methylophilaceae bacterium]
MSNTSKGTALITGASSGIGAVYADRLSKQGYNLILVARSEEKLNRLATQLSEETNCLVEVIRADLTNKADLATVEVVLKNDSNISMLINNAGVGSVASVLDSDVDEMEKMIALNITALTRLTYAIAPAFAEKNTGTIINISSVVGISSEFLNGVYSASKSYVLSFGHRLQKEFSSKGVRIQTVLPGATATPFWDAAGYSIIKSAPSTMSAEDCVDAALAGLDQGEMVTIPGLQHYDDWEDWENSRQALGPKLGNAKPGERYKVS